MHATSLMNRLCLQAITPQGHGCNTPTAPLTKLMTWHQNQVYQQVSPAQLSLTNVALTCCLTCTASRRGLSSAP